MDIQETAIYVASDDPKDTPDGLVRSDIDPVSMLPTEQGVTKFRLSATKVIADLVNFAPVYILGLAINAEGRIHIQSSAIPEPVAAAMIQTLLTDLEQAPTINPNT